MSATQDDTAPIIPASPYARIGRFSLDAGSGVWDWDEEVFRIHGLEPCSITPTTDYLLSCQHPEDRDRVADALSRAESDGRPFSVSHRLEAADGARRRVLMVCDAGDRASGAAVHCIRGYYIDMTEDFRRESQAVAQEAVQESAQHRATIEQAVGGLIVAYGLTAEQAFGMLRWWSQNKNVKVRELAARLVAATSTGAVSGPEIRAALDALLHDATADPTRWPTNGAKSPTTER